MSLVSYIVVFLMIWMILFFISLPIGVNIAEHHEEGFANSAPDKTNLKIKVIASFLISFVPACLIYWVVEKKLFYNFFYNNIL
jgi:predicted secreted protein